MSLSAAVTRERRLKHRAGDPPTLRHRVLVIPLLGVVFGCPQSTDKLRSMFPTLLGRPCLIIPSVTSNLADKGAICISQLHLSTPFCKPIVSGSWMTPGLKACDFSQGLATVLMNHRPDNSDCCTARATRSAVEQASSWSCLPLSQHRGREQAPELLGNSSFLLRLQGSELCVPSSGPLRTGRRVEGYL